MANPIGLLLRIWVVLVVMLSGISMKADLAADHSGEDDSVKSIRDRIPTGWTLRGRGNACTVSSPDLMPLHPSPTGGLPIARKPIQGHCEFIITVGRKLSIVEQRRLLEGNEKREHYKGEENVWIPDFYDEKNGYSIETPDYCPDKKEDQQAVNDCFKAIVHGWEVYPMSRFAKAGYFLDCLKMRPGDGNR
jgi:hypothetical protein